MRLLFELSGPHWNARNLVIDEISSRQYHHKNWYSSARPTRYIVNDNTPATFVVTVEGGYAHTRSRQHDQLTWIAAKAIESPA